MTLPAVNAWYVRGDVQPSGLLTVFCYVSNAFPDGEVVPDPGPTILSPVLWSTEPSDRGLTRVSLSKDAAPLAPAVWFVCVPEPKAHPAATNLVAFANDRFPEGTIVSNNTFAGLRIPNEEQAGAIRWYPNTGVVHQIFIAQQWRRRHLGTALIYAASAFHQANGWPDRLHSDGRRTDLGEFFVAGLRHPERIRPRDETMPPMDIDG